MIKPKELSVYDIKKRIEELGWDDERLKRIPFKIQIKSDGCPSGGGSVVTSVPVVHVGQSCEGGPIVVSSHPLLQRQTKKKKLSKEQQTQLDDGVII